MSESLNTLPQEEAFARILKRLHARWQLVILLPMFYLFGGLLLQRYYFIPERSGRGFLPMSDHLLWVALFLGGVLVAVLWRALTLQWRRHLLDLTAYRDNADAFLEKAKEQQLFRFGVCDLVSLPGLALFFLQGDIYPLVVFAFVSLVFYLRTIPSGKKLGIAYFRPDLLRQG